MKDSSLAEIGKAELNSELVEAVTKGRIYSGGFSDFRLRSKEADVILKFDHSQIIASKSGNYHSCKSSVQGSRSESDGNTRFRCSFHVSSRC